MSDPKRNTERADVEAADTAAPNADGEATPAFDGGLPPTQVDDDTMAPVEAGPRRAGSTSLDAAADSGPPPPGSALDSARTHLSAPGSSEAERMVEGYESTERTAALSPAGARTSRESPASRSSGHGSSENGNQTVDIDDESRSYHERRRGLLDSLAPQLGLTAGNPNVERGKSALRRAAKREGLEWSGAIRDAGGYLLGPEIGRGGMGRVHLAVDRDLGRRVAVKTLHGGRDAPRETLARFLEEAQATGQLEHPNIVPVHELGMFADGTVFFTMKLVGGRTLQQIIHLLAREDPETSRSFGRMRLLNAFQQVCLGVAFAHSRGVVHRDLKPGNIMLGTYGEVLVMDWGLAKIRGTRLGPAPAEPVHSSGATMDDPTDQVESFVHSETRATRQGWKRESIDGLADVWDEVDLPVETVRSVLDDQRTLAGRIFGTPYYMSPEQASGRIDDVNERSDVYSLGAILYTVLSHEPPVIGESVIQILERVRQGEIVPPSTRAPHLEVPSELEEICMRAMSREPGDRHPSARALAEDIELFLEGRKEQERRERDATQRHAAAEQELSRYQGHERRVEDLRREIETASMTIRPYDPPARKRFLWALEQELSQEETASAEAFGKAVDLYTQAVAAVPTHADARARLAELFLQRFEDAEERRAMTDAAYFRKLVERHDDGRLRGRLRGDGALSLVTDPAGARAELARYVEIDRVLVPRQHSILGPTPVRDVPLTRGSYSLRIVAAGCRPADVPVHVGRSSRARLHVKLYADSVIGDDFVYVPGGPFIAGGDPMAQGAWPRRIRELTGFFIGRFPVTAGQYLEFINDLTVRTAELAQQRLPRANPGSGHYWTRDDSGRYCLLDVDGDEWDRLWPVMGVSFDDAQAFCAWRGVRDGCVYRLPTEEEWEKAARGVDGRLFPWGDHFDATLCKMRASRDAAPRPEPVGSFEQDRSPFGVQDMAGGAREWCDSWFDDAHTLRALRGGSYFTDEMVCRPCYRYGARPGNVNQDLSFRLARTPPA